jgi:formate dehydrogenase subunit beta
MPIMPISAARMASLITDRTLPPNEAQKRVAVVMRPCELRAAVELAKLNQVRYDQLMTVGVDCVGTYEPYDFDRLPESPEAHLDNVLRAASTGCPDPPGDLSYRHACTICETPVPWNADISIHTIGVDSKNHLLLEVADESVAERLGLAAGADPSEHQAATRTLSETRHQRRTEELDRFAEHLRANGGSPPMLEEFEQCQRCHNCTVACPICYCKECLFRTATFAHEPRRYFGWASRKGAARLPGDTIAFQLTRLTHVTTSCVGCGLCTSACPAHLPVDTVFQTVARETQGLFGYVPGRDIGEALPAASFRQNEFVTLGESEH